MLSRVFRNNGIWSVRPKFWSIIVAKRERGDGEGAYCDSTFCGEHNDKQLHLEHLGRFPHLTQRCTPNVSNVHFRLKMETVKSVIV